MKSLRFNPNLYLLMGIALLAALALGPDSLQFFRGAALAVVYPISSPARTLASRINHRVVEPRKSVSQEVDAGTAFDELQNKYETLKSQFAILQSINDDLRQRLDERKDWPVDLLQDCEGAPVVGGDPGGRQELTLQPGSLRNPTEGANVLAGNDVVGRLKTFGLGSTKVQLITDPAVSVGVQLAHTMRDGSDVKKSKDRYTAHGLEDGTERGLLVVRRFKQADLKQFGKESLAAGDRVVLADNDWQRKVQGFTVGEVQEIRAADKPLFCDIVIRPRRDLMKLREVMVWKR